MVVLGSQPSAGAAALVLLVISAVNQGGRASSLTAPNGPSQQEVVRRALGVGGMAAPQVAGLQLHGTGEGETVLARLPPCIADSGDCSVLTCPAPPVSPPPGTALGDPIEVGAALGLLWEGIQPASRPPPTLLASKSTLGHSEPASGIMGLVRLARVRQGSKCRCSGTPHVLQPC